METTGAGGGALPQAAARWAESETESKALQLRLKADVYGTGRRGLLVRVCRSSQDKQLDLKIMERLVELL